ncbi:MAG TPA: DAK2 domain-containing protein [Candidatus Pullichristensenella avicola]|nr:DAK2 domain-containing protein [Candidatus Pullichristensenella avicola]
MAQTKIDGLLFKEMFQSGAALLTQNRESVDALNVFPVPDGDTGTNMSQTINSAVKEMQAKNAVSVGDVAAAIARGALKGARGNSGVILSQILRGFASALDGAEDIDCALMIRALRAGADTAYKAVMKPKEGTILTVARVMAEDAERNLREMTDIVELFRAILKSGEAILKKTPDMLPVLKQAGVVDSGGTGLTIIYRGMLAALTGEPVEVDVPTEGARAAMPGEFVDDHESLEEITFGYCTEFIVSHPRPEMRDSDVVRLRKRLERLGDCVLVISDLSVVKVHVHTNDPGKALQYALELGELDAIKIDNMFEEHRERMAKLAAEEAARQKPYGIVCVALGKGLSDIFTELNVDQIVDGGQTMNPSIEDLFEAIEKTHAQNVFVLPNNTNIILAAQQAAELTERNVVVLPTKSVPMGISAALAFDPEKGVEENRAAMTEAAENVHTASITYAVRDTNFDGHDIHAGDIMGLIDNKLHELGHDVREVAERLTEEMVTEDKSLITIYYGEDVTEEDAQTLLQALAEKYDQCDVDLQNGGQPLYYYLIAVE